MKTIALTSLLLALAAPALAQPKADEPASPPAAATAPAADLTDGEVRKVDREAKKLTLRHGEIRHLDMPPMTMVFQVKDASLLDRVKPGDKVRFAVQKADGGYLVTDIQPAK